MKKLYNAVGKSKDNETYVALQDCRKCYGRGHIGRNVKTNVLIPCRCLKVVEQDLSETIYLTENDYYEAHTVCPKCGSDKTKQTYLGYVFYADRPFKDENICECKCGWKGIVHELKPNNKTQDLSEAREEN